MDDLSVLIQIITNNLLEDLKILSEKMKIAEKLLNIDR